MGKLYGKKAVITGGSSGIGQSLAIAFAKEGAEVIFSYYQNLEGAEATTKEIRSYGSESTNIIGLKVNLEDEKALTTFIQDAISILGKIDIFINNAGAISAYKNFLAIPAAELKKIMDINLVAPFILTQQVTKHMIENSIAGSIINISSICSEMVSTGITHYECSKAAINIMTKSTANELAKHRIRVNAISPGLIESNVNDSLRKSNRQIWDTWCEKIPLQRAGTPNDIVPIAILLASDEGSWITGSIVCIDGGSLVKSKTFFD